jgi:hypothetical protein
MKKAYRLLNKLQQKQIQDFLELEPEDLASADPILIPITEFMNHAQAIAKQKGINPVEWPYYCIDWRQASRDLAQTYSRITIDGETYLMNKVYPE